MNIALLGNGDGQPDSRDFSEVMSGINMHDNASTNKLSFSDLKISGFEESLLTTLREDGTIDPNLDDINHELNKILISIGFKGIKDYKSSSIWRNQGKKKINPLFIRTKDRQKLKFLKMKFLEKQKRLRDRPIASEERETEEQKEFFKTVQRLVNKSPRNTRRNVNRKHLFTPESAMSALPSLCISTVSPKESIADEKRKYIDELVRKEKLNKDRALIISPTNRINTQQNQIESKKDHKEEILNISISDKHGECGPEPAYRDRSATKSFNKAVNPSKYTVYSNNPRSRTMKRELVNEDSKSLSLMHSTTSQMYPLNSVSIKPVNNDVKISLDKGKREVMLQPHNDAFMNRN